MNRDEARSYRKSLDAVLAKWAAEHGLDIESARCTYGTNEISFRVSARTAGTDNAELRLWKLMAARTAAPWSTFPDDLLALWLPLGTHEYQVAGYRDRARKRPVMVTRRDNQKGYAISLDQLEAMLRNYNAANERIPS